MSPSTQRLGHIYPPIRINYHEKCVCVCMAFPREYRKYRKFEFRQAENLQNAKSDWESNLFATQNDSHTSETKLKKFHLREDFNRSRNLSKQNRAHRRTEKLETRNANQPKNENRKFEERNWIQNEFENGSIAVGSKSINTVACIEYSLIFTTANIKSTSHRRCSVSRHHTHYHYSVYFPSL